MSEHKPKDLSKQHSYSLPQLHQSEPSLSLHNQTQSEGFLPQLNILNQRETPSFLCPGDTPKRGMNVNDIIENESDACYNTIDLDMNRDIKLSHHKQPSKKIKLPHVPTHKRMKTTGEAGQRKQILGEKPSQMFQ